MMDRERDLCVGCLRTSEELGNWARYTDEEKMACLERIRTR